MNPAPFTFYRGAAAMSGQYRTGGRGLCAAMLNSADEEAAAPTSGAYVPARVTAELRPLAVLEALTRVDLLKIDVEKAELDVLAGLADRLDRDPPARDRGPRHRRAPRSLAGDLGARGFAVTTEQQPAFRGTCLHSLFATR